MCAKFLILPLEEGLTVRQILDIYSPAAVQRYAVALLSAMSFSDQT